MTSTLHRIWCLIEGKKSVFPVTIEVDKDISHLKEKLCTGAVNPDTVANCNELELLQVEKPLKDFTREAFRQLRLTENDEGVEVLTSWKCVSDVWPVQPPTDKLHIFVKLPDGATTPGLSIDSNPTGTASSLAHSAPRKRGRSPTAEESGALKRIRAGSTRRTWMADGTICGPRKRLCYFLDPAEQIQNNDLVDAVVRCEFLLLVGARASGKTTRLMRLRELLQDMGYYCLYLSLDEVTYLKDVDVFWVSFGEALRQASPITFPIKISSPETFRDVFSKLSLNWSRPVVLLLDELDALFQAPIAIKDDLLRMLRGIKNNTLPTAITSVICAGTSNLARLDFSDLSLSSFNVGRAIQTPYFSIDETRQLFNMFEQDRNITIESEVVNDIWEKTRGHPGSVCHFGKVVSINLTSLLDDGRRTLSFIQWQKFPIAKIYAEFSAYKPFRRMITSLQNAAAREVINFYRSRFAGFFEDVELTNEENLADFLTSEGVLSQPHINLPKYRVASPLVDALVRLRIIPIQFPCAPSVFPKTHSGVLDIPFILKESLKFFDKEFIRCAYHKSYNLSTVLVDGFRGSPVPRASVYETELLRILLNWLPNTRSVTGQWHINHHVILQRDDKPIILEILATEEASTVKAHIENVHERIALLSAIEGWVIHFTCEDGFTPTFQTADDLHLGVNVIHVSHNTTDFSNVTLYIYSKNTGQRKYDICI